MSQASTSSTSAPSRLSVSPSWERRRARIDRLFRWVGFAATFFGLVMLLVFMADLAWDVNTWFKVMPGLIEQRNEKLRTQAAESEKYIAEQMREVHRQMQSRLAEARTEAERQRIRELYTTQIIPRREATLRETVGDFQQALSGIRTDTSPLALLGYFLTHGPSDQPQDAGILPALLGSIWLGIITVIFAVPLGVGAAVYLEEYSKRNWLAKVIQVNISNLAGVPSIVFGILGAFLFVELIFKPMESPVIAARNVLGGGMTLALLTLPVVIVAAQEAIRAVPVSIRHGAYALGATHWQVTRDLVLPSAMPGILTGTILAMSRAIGEAAPLIFFGALLFVNQNPTLFSRFTILPMQIFGWADKPEEAWRYNAAVASVVLLLTLLALNGVAIYLRQRGQRKMKW
jgi:phosphate transport system permease protein